jgi:SET domain-containing protein
MEDLVSVKKTDNRGLGIFAIRDIRKDEYITEFSGPVVKIPDFEGFPSEVIDHLFNIGPHDYIMAREPAVRTNHSCEPNAGIVKDVFMIAMRDIRAGEEVTFDYYIIIEDEWVMECQCGAPYCRKIIGKFRDLPTEIKKKYQQYTPDWIKR